MFSGARGRVVAVLERCAVSERRPVWRS